MAAPRRSPDPEATGWYLESAEERHRTHPESFFIPSREEREGLGEGRSVQLLFRSTDPEPHTERMWVTVESGDRSGYAGTLQNRPERLGGLAPGDPVAFDPEHVATILYSRQEMGYDSEHLMLISDAVPGGSRPRVLVHQPELRGDRASGWSALEGEEDQEHMDTSDHFEPREMGWFADRFPEAVEAFRAADGDAGPSWWVWSAEASAYRRLPDEAG